MVNRSRKVISLSWRKLEDQENIHKPITRKNSGPSTRLYDALEEINLEPESNECNKKSLNGKVATNADRKVARSRSRAVTEMKALCNLVKTKSTLVGETVQNKVLSGMINVGNAITALRQKMKRNNARHRKRLASTATPSPFRCAFTTPRSSARRSARLAYREVQMYSPFGFMTPAQSTPITALRKSEEKNSEKNTGTRQRKGSNAAGLGDISGLGRDLSDLVQLHSPVESAGVGQGDLEEFESARTRRSKRKVLFV